MVRLGNKQMGVMKEYCQLEDWIGFKLMIRTEWTRRKWNETLQTVRINKKSLKGGYQWVEIKECMFYFFRVTEALFSLVQRGNNTAVVAMSTINNLALEQGYESCQMCYMLW